MRAFRDGFFVAVHNQPRADRLRELFTELEHLGKLVSRVHVQEREGNRPRIERLASQVHEDAGVLPNRIQQYGIAKLRDDFADDVDRFGFERLKV